MNQPDQPDRESLGETTGVIANDPTETSLSIIYSRFIANHKPFAFQTRDRTLEFHPMPYRPEPHDPLLLGEPWRVMLEMFQDDTRMVLGLDLYGDVILGRGQSRPGHILVNLDPYHAQDLGVSREHAIIRPTPTELYVIDQGSTNGTSVNGAASGRGLATALHHEDLVRLGNLVLIIYMIERPAAVGVNL
jgi:hypothetical protein